MGCGHLFWGNKELQAHQKTLVQAAGQVGLGLCSSSAHVGSKTASYWPRTAPGEPDYTIRVHFTVMKNGDKCKERACPECKDKNPGKEKGNVEHV